MTEQRRQILQWAEQGHLSQGSLPEALRVAGAEPTADDWRRFLDRLTLWAGALFMAAGVIFFFAFNWQELGRFAKFGLAELGLVLAVALCWKLGLDQLSGKAALLVATLLVGALLALVGQTYQTGADPWQLFATWAVMVFPWVVIGRFAALLLFWVGLLNLSIILYFQTFPRLFGLVGLMFSTQTLLWTLFLLNTLVLCLWEYAAWRPIVWLDQRWPRRVLAVAGGGLITTLCVWAILEFRSHSTWALLGYPLWLAALYAVYRRWSLDIFVLAGGVLSVIIVVTAWLGDLLLSSGESAASLLIIGLLIIGLSAAGGFWLKTVAREESQ